ncbi:MAG: hypothetical protein GX087_11670 [Desulfobulbaceae bacterium]|nr:hypothetical protein [Desulfobulbaceae bacterium]
MEERRITFQLFGQEFSFFSDAPDEEIEQVVALLQEVFADQGGANRSTVPSTTLLVFGCLRVAAKLVQERQWHQRFRIAQERTIGTMIDKVVSHLD